MYEAYFGFSEAPFSIAPNPRYLLMTVRHREALAHLLYGVREGGGFVQLTGEVGTGKTTLCRHLLAELPEDIDAALILNPRIDELELMQSICDELRIEYPASATVKQFLDALNRHLLDAHARGRHTVLVIDEAQNLSDGVLEQIRLLTNLETAKTKLLQILLVGQGELRDHLESRSLRQLSQRITARYHLAPLDRREVREYIRHRLKQVGCERALFTSSAVAAIAGYSGGVPRLINVLCDRALLGAYVEGRNRVTRAIAIRAAAELRGKAPRRVLRYIGWGIGVLLVVLTPVAAYTLGWLPERVDREIRHVMPSWMPQFTPRNVSATPTRGRWLLIGEAAAGEAEPNLVPVTEPGLEPPRLRLAHDPEVPLRVAGIGSSDAADLLARFADLPQAETGRVGALRTLAGMWALPDAVVFDCVGIAEYGLACMNGARDIDRLMRLDRPAVVELSGRDGAAYHAVLTHIVSERAILRAGELELAVSLEDLGELWRGSSVVFWRRPPLVEVPVTEASAAEDILWLRRAVNLEAANYGGITLSRVEQAVFDVELLDALHVFQRRNGLEVRDLAGEEELIILNTRLGYEAHPILVY